MPSSILIEMLKDVNKTTFRMQRTIFYQQRLEYVHKRSHKAEHGICQKKAEKSAKKLNTMQAAVLGFPVPMNSSCRLGRIVNSKEIEHSKTSRCSKRHTVDRVDDKKGRIINTIGDKSVNGFVLPPAMSVRRRPLAWQTAGDDRRVRRAERAPFRRQDGSA